MKTRQHPWHIIPKITLLVFFVFNACCSSSAQETPIEFALIFGACFENENVSLKLNHKLILDHYQLGFQKKLKKGNLNLKQTDKNIIVSFNGKEKKMPKIKSTTQLQIDITLNGRLTKFTVDLRKGNILLLEFCPTVKDDSKTRKLKMEQRQEAVILM